MNNSIEDKLKTVSFSNGKFLSDKSYAYDTVYFISKFILEYSENKIFDLPKWKNTLIDYITEKWQLLDRNDGILNYYLETINLLEYSQIIKKEGNKVKILDEELLDYITKNGKMENSYIFVYLSCYFTLKNSGCLNSYENFCNTNIETEKKQYLNEIYECLSTLNISIKNKDAHNQWAKQNTQYIMNVLNFINHQPWVTREFNFNYQRTDEPEMISVNIKGPKTKYPKKNEYLSEFDYKYVIENLNDYIVKRS